MRQGGEMAHERKRDELTFCSITIKLILLMYFRLVSLTMYSGMPLSRQPPAVRVNGSLSMRVHAVTRHAPGGVSIFKSDISQVALASSERQV